MWVGEENGRGGGLFRKREQCVPMPGSTVVHGQTKAGQIIGAWIVKCLDNAVSSHQNNLFLNQTPPNEMGDQKLNVQYLLFGQGGCQGVFTGLVESTGGSL